MILNLFFYLNFFNELIVIVMFNCFDELYFVNLYFLFVNIKFVYKYLDIICKYFVWLLNFVVGYLMNEL